MSGSRAEEEEQFRDFFRKSARIAPPSAAPAPRLPDITLDTFAASFNAETPAVSGQAGAKNPLPTTSALGPKKGLALPSKRNASATNTATGNGVSKADASASKVAFDMELVAETWTELSYSFPTLTVAGLVNLARYLQHHFGALKALPPRADGVALSTVVLTNLVRVASAPRTGAGASAGASAVAAKTPASGTAVACVAGCNDGARLAAAAARVLRALAVSSLPALLASDREQLSRFWGNVDPEALALAMAQSVEDATSAATAAVTAANTAAAAAWAGVAAAATTPVTLSSRSDAADRVIAYSAELASPIVPHQQQLHCSQFFGPMPPGDAAAVQRNDGSSAGERGHSSSSSLARNGGAADNSDGVDDGGEDVAVVAVEGKNDKIKDRHAAALAQSGARVLVLPPTRGRNSNTVSNGGDKSCGRRD